MLELKVFHKHINYNMTIFIGVNQNHYYITYKTFKIKTE